MRRFPPSLPFPAACLAIAGLAVAAWGVADTAQTGDPSCLWFVAFGAWMVGMAVRWWQIGE